MLNEIGRKARIAARVLASSGAEQRNGVLTALADRIVGEPADILAANRCDLDAAQANGLSSALIDRLTLNEKRLAGMAADLCTVAELPDPVGEVFEERLLPNGLRLRRQRVPIGVLGVIYESRPNVTIDIAGLAIKSGPELHQCAIPV